MAISITKELSIGTTMTEEKATDIYAVTNDLMGKVKKLNIPAVSNSLPVDYLQTEMIKAIKELAKESTAPDKDTPDWMENDIKRGMQWMHKKLTGNDC